VIGRVDVGVDGKLGMAVRMRHSPGSHGHARNPTAHASGVFARDSGALAREFVRGRERLWGVGERVRARLDGPGCG
jgi:hypothetical protein